MSKKYILFLVLAMLAHPALAAFSTPYLPENTLTLYVDEEYYDFEVVFQNPELINATMTLQILTGNEWTDPDNITVTVPAKTFDVKDTIRITPPEDIVVGKRYPIEYAVSSGEPGGEGMVPVVSKVVKKFEARVIERPVIMVEAGNQTANDSINETLMQEVEEKDKIPVSVLIIGLIVFVVLIVLVVEYRKAKKQYDIPNNEDKESVNQNNM